MRQLKRLVLLGLSVFIVTGFFFALPILAMVLGVGVGILILQWILEEMDEEEKKRSKKKARKKARKARLSVVRDIRESD